MNRPGLLEMRVKEVRAGAEDAAVVFAIEGSEDILPFPLDPAAARALGLELSGAPGEKTAVSTPLENAVRHLNGRILGAEIGFSPRPGPLVHLVVDQDGKEVRMPARITDAVALARRHKVPVCADAEARKWMCVHPGETGASAAGMDWNETYRLVMGFTALGRADDAILSIRRLRELEPSRESWCAGLGALYRRKGWLTHAAAEYAKALAWSVREGYISGAAGIAKAMGAIDFGTLPLRTVRAPAMIEDFASPEFTNEWWGAGQAVPGPVGKPGRTYRLGADRDWMIIKLLGGQTWEGARALSLDIFVGAKHPKPLRALFSLSLAGPLPGWYHAAPRDIGEGWTVLTFPLADAIWNEGERKGLRLDASPLGPVTDLQLGLPDGRPASGDIYLANIRLE